MDTVLWISLFLHMFIREKTTIILPKIEQCELESNKTNDIEESEFEVYPNPAHNSVFIKTSEIGQLTSNIELYNNNGEIVNTNIVRQSIILPKIRTTG